MKPRSISPPPQISDSQYPISRASSNEELDSSDLHNPLPSPPYRSFATSSQVVLDSGHNMIPGMDSPAYRSRVNLMTDYNVERQLADEKSSDFIHNARPGDDDIKAAQPKPTVHYPANVPVREAGAHGYHNSPPRLDSRASSVGGGTDDEHDDDEGEDYDWSAEEDLEDQEAQFEKQMGVKPKPQGWGLKRIATFLFSSLIGSTLLAGIVVTPAIITRFFWFNKDKDNRRVKQENIDAWLFWAAANILISWYLAMIVDIIPAIIRFIISAGWGHVSEHIKSMLEMYDSVKDTIKPLLYAASAWASWVIVFENIYKLYVPDPNVKSPAPYTDRVHQAIEFLFFLALVICAQRMLSHAIAFAFHRTAYADRIDSVRTTLSVIESLRNYQPKPPTPSSFNPFKHYYTKSGTRTPVLSALGFGGGEGTRTPFNEKEHFDFLSGALRSATPHGTDSEGEDGDVEDGGDKNGSKNKGKQKRRSLRPPDRADTSGTLSSTVKSPASEFGSRPVTPSGLNPNRELDSPHRYPPSPARSRRNSVDENEMTLAAAAKVLKTAVLHDARNIKGKDSGLKALIWNINSTHEAKRLAKSIYYRFKDRKRVYLIPSDFYPAFNTPAEAETAFRVFDKDDNGDISRSEIKSTLLKTYKERRFLSRSMRDVGNALKTLDHILLFFALVILFFISLSVFGVEVGDSLTSVYSVGIAASFIFKNTASSAFDAIMFLFVTHPYDTGDRVFIDDENFVVKKMGLFATVFTRADGTETYYFNSQLFVKFITNVRRSGKMYENLTMQVAWRTSLEKLDTLEKCINDWLQTEENRWFEPNTSIVFQTIDYQRHLEITMAFGHNGTWQDWGLRCARKTAFHAAVQYYCRELGIVAYEAPIPVEWADTDTLRYEPDEDYVDPQSPVGSVHSFETGPAAEPSPMRKQSAMTMQNVLGFKPPQDQKHSELTRTRKSKSRKNALRSMGAGG